MNTGLKDRLLPLAQDRISGSLHLLQSLTNIIISYCKERKTLQLAELRDVTDMIQHHLGQFAVIYHFSRFLNEITGVVDTYEIKSKLLMKQVIDYNKQWDMKMEGGIGNCVEELTPGSPYLLLHSNSGTIHRLVNSLTRQGSFPDIIQTLSGPGNEGIQQAEILASMGCPVKLIHESSAGIFMKEIDAVVLGADILSNDFFMNKTGSMELSLLAKHHNKPVYVLADQRKRLDIQTLPAWLRKKIETPQPMPPAEILSHPLAGVEAVNYYFEWIPNELVTEFFY